LKKIVLIENHITGAINLRAKLLEKLHGEGYNITVMAGEVTSESINNFTSYKIINVGISSTNPFSVFSYCYKLYKALKDEQPDICLTWSIRPNIYANFVSRFLKIPTISTISGIGPLLESNSFAYILARRLYKMALKKTKKVFFQNSDDLSLFRASNLSCAWFWC
jgi:UDP-N-acetylglucosamine:LPS N-acetylglucosamine transferase